MGVIVAFDFNAFSATFPELEPIGAPLAGQYFAIATLMHANDGSGPISSAAVQSSLLNLLTAHIAWLFAPRDASGNPAQSGSAAPNLTGRVSSATEGSISVQTEALEGFNTAQASWLSQTRYGALYWASTARFRVMHYRRGPCLTRPGIFPLNFR